MDIKTLILANIEYINLLPFKLFIKRYYPSLYKRMLHHKGTPKEINKKFKNRQINSAFISSIKSKRTQKITMGISAKGEVQSVLVLKGENKKDENSDTSNVLAQILNIKGEVIIGDRALKVYLKKEKDFIDLSEFWFKKYKLPFVFATFSINTYKKLYNKIQQEFLNHKIKIPFFVSKNVCLEKDITRKELLDYLNVIYYDINYKERLSLKLFRSLAKNYQ
jgi:chorismate dehydratase